jgi:hypothetical protein
MRITLPVPVILNRLAAARFVFIFGMISLPFRFSFFAARCPGYLDVPGSEKHDQRPAFRMRRLLHDSPGTEQIDHPLQDTFTQVLVHDLPPAEQDGHFDFRSVSQELLDLANLGFQVMRVDPGTQADLLDFDRLLPLARFSFPPALLVAVFAVIHDPADRRTRIGLDFYQIEPPFTSQAQGLCGTDNP